VLPEQSSSEPFEWKKSLDSARAALRAGDSTAGRKLFQALADAARMAELCHDRLFDMPPGKISDRTLQEWRDFLKTIYDDTLKVYMLHTDLAQPSDSGSLLKIFKAIRDAARTASFGLKYMDAGESEQEGRESAVQKLEKLMTELQAAVSKLQPENQPDEADETPADIDTREVVYVPRVGRIAAGSPNLAEQSIEGYYPLPKQLVGSGELYLLDVAGDSMIDAGIADGDQVVVRAQPQAENGQIVVAMIDGEATIKTFKRSEGHAWLVPHNPKYQKTLGDEAIILGKVVAVLRKA
jgi:SOS regulatory protein LexA